MGSACSVWTTLGLSQLMAHVLSQSTLLRLQIALQGNCPRWALGFVHFPGLSCSGSGSQVPTKAQTPMDMHFVPFPGPSSSGDQVLGEHTLQRWQVHLITSLVPAAWFPGWSQLRLLRCGQCLFWGADIWLQPSRRMSTIQNPRKSWLATRSLPAVW